MEQAAGFAIRVRGILQAKVHESISSAPNESRYQRFSFQWNLLQTAKRKTSAISFLRVSWQIFPARVKIRTNDVVPSAASDLRKTVISIIV